MADGQVPARRGASGGIADDHAPGALPPPGERRDLRRARGVRAKGSRARGDSRWARTRLGARPRRLGGHGAAAARAPRTGSRGAVARPLSRRLRGSRLALPMLILNAPEVEQLLDMPGCMAAMEEALVSLARGEFHLPLRPVVRPPGEPHFLGLMPTFRSGERPLYALKTVAIFPDNPSRGLDPHQGTVTLYDGATGEVLAVMNASPITAIRTAAVSGIATRALAREDARVLAMVGAGHQAHPHMAAMFEARQFEDVR